MTTKKKAGTGKGRVKKLKLKKETVKDLATKGSVKVRPVVGLRTIVGQATCTPTLCGGFTCGCQKF